MVINRINLYGAITANIINISTISIFIARLLEKPEIGHWIGLIIQFSIIPLVSWCKAGAPVRIQSALSQEHPKAAGS